MLKQSSSRPTQIAADLATPRWSAAQKFEFGLGKHSSRSQNAKLLNKSLAFNFNTQILRDSGFDNEETNRLLLQT